MDGRWSIDFGRLADLSRFFVVVLVFPHTHKHKSGLGVDLIVSVWCFMLAINVFIFTDLYSLYHVLSFLYRNNTSIDKFLCLAD